jgi:hypothetical protein
MRERPELSGAAGLDFLAGDNQLKRDMMRSRQEELRSKVLMRTSLSGSVALPSGNASQSE